MDNNSRSAAGSNESDAKIAHEYIKDILPFSYQKCLSCGNRTDLTCVRCSYCYSCHWKKEKVERRLIDDKISEIFPSPFLRSEKKALVNSEIHRQQQLLPEKPKQQLVVDVNGRITEPVCTYHGCDHKFSDHGLRNRKCKHPSNKALGVFNKYL
jgi:hypothetical protein